MASDETKPSIPNFFENQSILITGCTSFLEKILVEKLLRSCPNLDTIYLLGKTRFAQNKDAWLAELKRSKVFSNIRQNNAEALGKLRLVCGGLSEESLGLNEEDRELLVEHVSVVIHTASVFKFDSTLEDMLSINVLGTQRVVHLCNELPKLKVLVFVSTIFSHCHKIMVSETVDPAPTSHDENSIKALIDSSEKNLSIDFTQRTVGPWKAPFAFTAALAERFLADEINNFKCAIVRPSIVTSCWNEPSPGFKPTKSEMTAYDLLQENVLRSVKTEQFGAAVDMVPADLVSNLIIAAAWHVALSESNGVSVFNCSSEQHNPVRWRDVTSGVYKLWGFHWLKEFIEEALGNIPEWHGTAKSFFPINSSISTERTEELLHLLSEEDRTTFNFAVQDVVWSMCGQSPNVYRYVVGQIFSNLGFIISIGLHVLSLKTLVHYTWNRKSFTETIMKALSDALPKAKRRVHPET